MELAFAVTACGELLMTNRIRPPYAAVSTLRSMKPTRVTVLRAAVDFPAELSELPFLTAGKYTAACCWHCLLDGIA